MIFHSGFIKKFLLVLLILPRVQGNEFKRDGDAPPAPAPAPAPAPTPAAVVTSPPAPATPAPAPTIGNQINENLNTILLVALLPAIGSVFSGSLGFTAARRVDFIQRMDRLSNNIIKKMLKYKRSK